MTTHTARITAAVALLTALLTACGEGNTMNSDGVDHPITPEQSKAQVVDAARDVVGTLGLQPIRPAFWHASCNDQGDPPFRGQMRIGYPQAATPDASAAEIADMVGRLRNDGWTTADDFRTHGTALRKNGVVAVFSPQNASVPTRSLEFFGECADVTTTKDTAGTTEIVDLA